MGLDFQNCFYLHVTQLSRLRRNSLVLSILFIKQVVRTSNVLFNAIYIMLEYIYFRKFIFWCGILYMWGFTALQTIWFLNLFVIYIEFIVLSRLIITSLIGRSCIFLYHSQLWVPPNPAVECIGYDSTISIGISNESIYTSRTFIISNCHWSAGVYPLHFTEIS